MSNTPSVLTRLRKVANLPPFSVGGLLGKSNVGGGIFGSNGVPTQSTGPRSVSRGTGALAAIEQQREILNTCVRATDPTAPALIAAALAGAEDANLSVIGPGNLDLTALANFRGLSVRGKNVLSLSRGARIVVDRSAVDANDATLFNLIQGSLLTVQLCPGLSLSGIDITSGSLGNAVLAICAGGNVSGLTVEGWGSVNITGGGLAVGVTHPTATPTQALFSSLGNIIWNFAVAAGGTSTWTWYPAAAAAFDVPGDTVDGASFTELQRFASRFLRNAVVLISAFEASNPPRWISTVNAQNVRASISGTVDAGGAVVDSYFDVLTDEEATSSEITVIYSFTVATVAAVIAPLFRGLAPGGTPRGRLANVFLQTTTDAPITTASSISIVAQSAEDIFIDATAHDGPVDFTGTLNLEADGFEFDGLNDVTLGASDVDLQTVVKGALSVTTFDLRRLLMIDTVGGNAHALTFNRAGDITLNSTVAGGSTVTFTPLGTVGTLGAQVDRLVANGVGPVGGGVTFTLTLTMGFDIKTVELAGGVEIVYTAEVGLVFELSLGSSADDRLTAAAATAVSAVVRIVADAFPGATAVGATVLDAAPLVGRTPF